MKDDVRLYKGVNCSELFWEYPFFKDGMWLSEFQCEEQKYFDFMENGGTTREYIELLKNR